MKYLRELVGAGVAVLTCLFLATAGCKEAREAAAESAYTAEHLRCVDKATTLAESRACRAEVDRRWGITEVARDGGRE